MAIQQSIDKLKQKPKDDRKAIASSISIAVGTILFIGWLLYFFHQIQSGAVSPSLQAGNEFSQQAMQQAQDAFQQQQDSPNQDLIQLRDQIQAQQLQTSVQPTAAPQNVTAGNTFNASPSGN